MQTTGNERHRRVYHVANKGCGVCYQMLVLLLMLGFGHTSFIY